MANHIILDMTHADPQTMSMDMDMNHGAYTAQGHDKQNDDNCHTSNTCSSSGHCCSAMISVSFDIEALKPSGRLDPVHMALIQLDSPPAFKPPRTIHI